MVSGFHEVVVAARRDVRNERVSVIHPSYLQVFIWVCLYQGLFRLRNELFHMGIRTVRHCVSGLYEKSTDYYRTTNRPRFARSRFQVNRLQMLSMCLYISRLRLNTLTDRHYLSRQCFYA